jgi:hypothetical protein
MLGILSRKNLTCLGAESLNRAHLASTTFKDSVSWSIRLRGSFRIYSKYSIVLTMEHTQEVRDLSGEVAILSYRPVFKGPYSTVYHGRLKNSNELVSMRRLWALSLIELSFCRSPSKF